MRTFVNVVSAVAVGLLVLFLLGPPLGPAVVGLSLVVWLTIRFRLWWAALAAAILAWLSLLVITGNGPLWLRMVLIFVELSLILLPVNLIFRLVRARL